MSAPVVGSPSLGPHSGPRAPVFSVSLRSRSFWLPLLRPSPRRCPRPPPRCSLGGGRGPAAGGRAPSPSRGVSSGALVRARCRGRCAPPRCPCGRGAAAGGRVPRPPVGPPVRPPSLPPRSRPLGAPLFALWGGVPPPGRRLGVGRSGFGALRGCAPRRRAPLGSGPLGRRPRRGGGASLRLLPRWLSRFASPRRSPRPPLCGGRGAAAGGRSGRFCRGVVLMSPCFPCRFAPAPFGLAPPLGVPPPPPGGAAGFCRGVFAAALPSVAPRREGKTHCAALRS